MSWIVAGSVVADVPVEIAGHHFYDPRTGLGLSSSTSLGLARSAGRHVSGAGSVLRSGGEPAKLWWKSPANALGYEGFLAQFRKAVASAGSYERNRHLAGSLISAGAMLHVLQDMGSPSHVRDDLGAHHDRVGTDLSDLGSRFERVAALAFGRLGIPRSAKAPELASLADHFSNTERNGLADITERGYFSRHTLPRSAKVKRDAGSSTFRKAIETSLRRPEPAPPTRLDLVAARNPNGATWINERGVCLAQYKWRRSKITWKMDDACALEQLEDILPTVAAYGSSFLEMLFPSDLSLTKHSGQLVAEGSARYTKGSLTVFADAADGTRTQFHSLSLSAQAEDNVLGNLPAPPKGSTRVTLLFDGQDSQGNPLLATTSSVWPFPEKTSAK